MEFRHSLARLPTQNLTNQQSRYQPGLWSHQRLNCVKITLSSLRLKADSICCGCRTEVSVFSLVVIWGPLSASRDHLQFFATWSSDNMAATNRERERESLSLQSAEMESYQYNAIMRFRPRHLCHIQLIRSRSQVLPYLHKVLTNRRVCLSPPLSNLKM